MPLARFIPADIWSALPEIDVEVGEDLTGQLGADTYRPVLSGVAAVTVPAVANPSDVVPAAIGSDPTLEISGGGLLVASNLSARFRITNDPQDLFVAQRVAAIALLSNYTGNEQNAAAWGAAGETAAFVGQIAINGEVELSVTVPGRYVAIWEAREADHSTNPPDPRRWSDGSVASAQFWLDNAPAAMAAPTLAVTGDTITVTFPADPASTAPITRYDVAYRPVGGALTVLQDVTSGLEITGLASGDWQVAVAAANAPGGAGAFTNFATETVASGSDTVPPVADSLTMGAQAADGNAKLTIAGLSEAGTMGVVWTSTNQSSATAEAIKAAAEGGTPLTDQLSVETQAVAPLEGPYTITDGLPTDQDGTVYWQVVIWDAAGNVETVYSGSIVLDTDGPQFASAEIGSVDATSLIVTMSEGLDGSTAAGDWTVLVDASPATISAAAISGSTVDLTLAAAVTEGATVTVAFTGTSLTDSRGNIADTFTAQSVTNNVAAAPSGPTLAQPSILGYADTGSNLSQITVGPVTVTSEPNQALVVGVPFIAAGNTSNYSNTVATYGAVGRAFGTGTPMAVFGPYDPISRRVRGMFAVLIDPPLGEGEIHITFRDGTPADFSMAGAGARIFVVKNANQDIGNYAGVSTGINGTTSLSTSFAVPDGMLLSILTILGGDVDHTGDIIATLGGGDLIVQTTAGATGLSDAILAYATETVPAGTDGSGFSWNISDEAAMASLIIPGV